MFIVKLKFKLSEIVDLDCLEHQTCYDTLRDVVVALDPN